MIAKGTLCVLRSCRLNRLGLLREILGILENAFGILDIFYHVFRENLVGCLDAFLFNQLFALTPEHASKRTEAIYKSFKNRCRNKPVPCKRFCEHAHILFGNSLVHFCKAAFAKAKRGHSLHGGSVGTQSTEVS